LGGKTIDTRYDTLQGKSQKPLLLLLYILTPVSRSLHGVVMQELFDEVYVGEDHTPTAVSLKLQFVKSVAFGHVFCEEVEVGIPFVTDDLPAREATNRDNHGGQ